MPTIGCMTHPTRNKRIATQALCLLGVVVAAVGWALVAAHSPPDPAALKIVAETAQSQAVEARETGMLKRAERLPRGIAVHHLDQLGKQIAGNRKKAKPS